MEKTLSELIREYKDGGKRNFEKIAEKMNPLIEFYARKLYTWDREDARQEMLLALFLSLEKMKYCRNEGETLSYLKTGIRRRYKDLNSHARLACYTMNKTGVASGSFS